MANTTPTTAEVRSAWVAWNEPGDDRWTPEEFDRWLSNVKREAIAEFASYRYMPRDVRSYIRSYLDT